MKLKIAVAICLLAFVLCACGGYLGGVDELLSAPKLSEEQKAVIEAVESGITTEDSVKLKYPQTGSTRAPLSFADLDNDGEREAIVFYSLSSKTQLVHIAILNKTPTGWMMLSETEGRGTDIDKVDIVEMSDGDVSIIVGWASVNVADKVFCMYRLENEELTQKYERNYVEYVSGDFNGDDFDDIIWIAPDSAANETTASLLCESVGGYHIYTRVLADEVIVDVVKIQTDTVSGKLAAYIDMATGSNKMRTEIVLFNGMALIALSDIGELSSRELSEVVCFDIDSDGVLDIPSVQPPESIALNIPPEDEDEPLQEEEDSGKATGVSDCFWYGVGDSEAEFICPAILSKSGMWVLVIPDFLVGRTVVTQNKETKVFAVSFMPSADYEAERLADISIIGVGESSAALMESGFAEMGSIGAYRYFVKTYGLSVENILFDEVYVKNSFILLK